MAPEQVSGEPDVDGRADQYALGVVAYELLTGRRPFTGDTVQGILAAHLLETPEPIAQLRPDLPPALVRIVMRCLEKDPRRRWQRSEELAQQLEAVALALGGVTPPKVRGILLAGTVAAGFAFALGVARSPAPLSGAPMADQLSFSGAIGMSAISPDGRFLAYVSREEGTVYLQELARGPALEIARGLTDVLALRWSPDGTQLLMGGRYQGQPGSYVLSRLGGALRRIRHDRLGQWHPSGLGISTWDYPDKSIRLVDLESGDERDIALPGTYDWLYDTEWSPSGSHLAYVTMSEPDRYALRLVSPDGSGVRTLLQDSLVIGSPRWAPREDALYYLRGRAELKKLRLHPSSGAPRGDPVTLVDGMQAAPGEVPGVTTPFTITGDARRLIYLKSLDYSNLWRLSGGPLSPGEAVSSRRLTSGTAARRGVAISPDRKWVAYLESSPEGTDLFRMPVEGGGAERLTFGGRVASQRPAWSPDGHQLAFGTHHGGAVRIATISATGGPPRMFEQTSLPAIGDVAWAPGRRILHQVAGNRNFRILDPSTGEQSWLVPGESRGWMFAAHPSPDGERVAVYWNRRPLRGIWAVSLRDASEALLIEGRFDPVGWSGDGRSVLAVGWDSGGIIRVDLDGRTRTLGRLPFREAECASAEGAGSGVLLCAVPEQLADAWMVTGFDPERH
jgi:Tol biopolymer transport system component